jgi:indole-3-glycerol phosphate synthase
VTILAELVAAARVRATLLPRTEPDSRASSPAFSEALRGKDRLSVVAEFKRASPSLGAIAPDAEVLPRVRKYSAAGAAAISVLTEPLRFGGSLEDLEVAAGSAAVPVLMKDFVVSVAQVRAAARLGARAVLLIVRCLEPAELSDLAAACSHYGLTPLVECHVEADLERALEIPRAVIGVNNRDLDTLIIDRTTALRLLPRVPRDRVAIAESGYEAPAQAREVLGVADAVLVGSALMAGGDPGRFIREVSA